MHLDEMIQRESTCDVARVQFDMHDSGMCMEVYIYDNACHLDAAVVRNVPSLKFLEFASHHFHKVFPF